MSQAGVSADAMRPLLEVRPEYLEASMDAMERAYGGVERFVTGQLGVDIGSLRAHYLEA
jgi:protein-tyrosine phosphatase